MGEKEENETQTTIEEENVEIYVPSKLNKVENKMAESIELGKKEKTEKKEEEQNKKEIETEQETEEQKEEDNKAEFVFAESQNVSGREETESGKNDWNKYKKYDVMDRADLYAKSNNIKRTTTFLKKVKQEKKRKATENAVNLAKIYEDKLKEEKEENETQTTIEEENVEIYVPSKLNKVENKMAESIELGKKEKTEKRKRNKIKKRLKPNKKTEEQKEEDNKAEYVAADNKKNENE